MSFRCLAPLPSGSMAVAVQGTWKGKQLGLMGTRALECPTPSWPEHLRPFPPALRSAFTTEPQPIRKSITYYTDTDIRWDSWVLAQTKRTGSHGSYSKLRATGNGSYISLGVFDKNISEKGLAHSPCVL